VGVEVYLHVFLTSARDGGEWSALRPGRFTPRETAPGTHWIGRWVGPRTGLDAVPAPPGSRTPDHPARSSYDFQTGCVLVITTTCHTGLQVSLPHFKISWDDIKTILEVKSKKLPLCLIKHHVTKTYGLVEV
jgi:hypothetical protein